MLNKSSNPYALTFLKNYIELSIKDNITKLTAQIKLRMKSNGSCKSMINDPKN